MTPRQMVYALFLVLISTHALAEAGKVTLPVAEWEGLLKEIEVAGEPELPAVTVSRVERRIEGGFQKGLLSATLHESFIVHDNRGHRRVPILDGRASIDKVTLNGQSTSLLSEGTMYTVGVDAAGTYEIQVSFYFGQEQESFASRLQLRLPPGGSTKLSVFVPEREIEPKLENGAFESLRREGQGTRLIGHLDASGNLDLAWESDRRATHAATGKARTEVSLNTLFTLGEALVTGVANFDIEVLEGEIGRVELRLPKGIEVLRVKGPAVLQWETDPNDGGRLVVYLRYRVEASSPEGNQARVSVDFQFPVESDDEPVTLRMPLPLEGVPMHGSIGVQGPAGLNIEIEKAAKANELTPRDLPTDLVKLTDSPLLFGFSFAEPPEVSLRSTRLEEVELTSTIIDELQATTLMIEDGTQITKLKLRVRNNIRQHLTLELPPGARFTHSLIDGSPIRPAIDHSELRQAQAQLAQAKALEEGAHQVSETGARTEAIEQARAELALAEKQLAEIESRGDILLFPLRQSERIGGARARYHVVGAGETLSAIANFYYSDPRQTEPLLEANPEHLYDEHSLSVGQRLLIPAGAGSTVEESSFVLELAYKERREALGSLGRRWVGLPKIDVDTVKVTWHLYFPQALLPLAFEGNLTQYSFVRYDPFRRIQQFLRRALRVRDAWAGGKYQSILKQRRSIYREETQKEQAGAVVLASFPLVGRQYRFKRLLLGQQRPSLAISYVDQSVATPVRWLALLMAFGAALVVLRSGRTRRDWLGAAAILLGLLILAHYFLGVHRRILWGVDLALLVTWGRLRLRPWLGQLWKGIRAPWRVWEMLTLKNLLFFVGLCGLIYILAIFPLLLSSIALLVLLIGWRRGVAKAREEVAHA